VKGIDICASREAVRVVQSLRPNQNLSRTNTWPECGGRNGKHHFQKTRGASGAGFQMIGWNGRVPRSRKVTVEESECARQFPDVGVLAHPE
jgi:quinolinate synthase